MKIVKDNRKHGEVVLSVTSLDDLWFLSQVIEKGDAVTAKTVRKMKLGGQEERKANVVKKWVQLTLEVEKVEFHKYTNALRVAGKITEASGDIQRGAFHTINIEEGSKLTVKKEVWLKHQWSRLQEATKEKFPKVLLCVLDRKEVSFALLKRYGYDLMSELEGEVQEKRFPILKKSATFYQDIVKRIQEYVKRFKIEYIIIASPAFWKDEIMKEVNKNAQELKNKVTLATCNATGKNALNEVLKRDEVKKLLKNERLIQEIALVDEIFTEIGKNGAVTYGLQEVEKVAQTGAVKTLLITTDLIRSLRQENRYDQLDKVMKLVEQAQGDIHIITTEHDAGQRLQGITGIAALLRYKIYG